MGSIKETNESGCRSMPGPGICMIVLEFISSVNRETLSYYIYCIRKVENSSSSSFHAFYFIFADMKLKPLLGELSIVIWAPLKV